MKAKRIIDLIFTITNSLENLNDNAMDSFMFKFVFKMGIHNWGNGIGMLLSKFLF